MRIVGFTDWISTRGPSAFALIETSVGGNTLSKQTQMLTARICIVWLIRCHAFGNVRSGQAFDQEPGTTFGDRETQFQIGVALCLDLRQLRVKQQLRVRQTQPLLWIAA